MKKQIVVIHSGGMDSSICLAAAIRTYGAEAVLSLTFDYHQRHAIELSSAETICKDWGVDHAVVDMRCMEQITQDALTGSAQEIEVPEQGPPNTLVVGRNGLMVRLAAIHAHSLGAHRVSTGVIGVEGQHSGYRDCSREYMDLMQTILRIDLDDPNFEVLTPVVHMTKCETLEWAEQMGVLDYLIHTTITCYRGISHPGCGDCPACELRNQGIAEFKTKYPEKADLLIPRSR